MSAQTDLREPAMGEYEGQTQWNCQWPGCEFDTLDEAQWREHIDPVTGRHPEPRGDPGTNEPQRLIPTERAEFEDLKAEVKELRASKAKAEKDAPTTTTTAPPKGDQTKAS
jgi:hypothetical protein